MTMKLETIHTDTFQQILKDGNSRTLIMKWLPGTQNINYSQFKGSLLIFAGFSEQHEPANILIDATDMRSQDIPMQEMMQWRTREVTPHYNASGVQKFAYLFSAGAKLPPSGQTDGENFTTHYFDTEADVLAHFGIGNN